MSRVRVLPPLLFLYLIPCGALAQLGARHTGSVEARGSNPLCSILIENARNNNRFGLFAYIKETKGDEKMSLETFYEKTGGSYEEILGRLRSPEMILRFAKMYAADPSWKQLHDALDHGNAEDAFRAAHTLKGVSQNLGFTKLYEASAKLTEELRGGKPLVHKELVDAVDQIHQTIIDNLGELDTE